MLDFLVFLGFFIALVGAMSPAYFLRMLRVPKEIHYGKVSLILPLTGPALRLEALFQALAQQSLIPRRLIIAVESESDPAFKRVCSCKDMLPFPVQVVVGGIAESSGQKSKNLMAALSIIDDSDDVVVMLDADVQPSSEWLAYLASPVISGQYDVVSGYRWQWMPVWKPATLIIAAIDRSIALAPRFPGYFMPWGGSIALGKTALQRINWELWLGRSLTEDCALGLEVNRLKLRALVRRVLLVKSPVEGSLKSLWLFGRRQYQLIRFYMPIFWWISFSIVGLRTLAWIVLLLPFNFAHAGVLAVGMFGATLLGVLLQQRVESRLGLQDATSGFWFALVVVLAKPLIDLFHLTLVAGAAASNVVTWGHVRYRVESRTKITVLERSAP